MEIRDPSSNYRITRFYPSSAKYPRVMASAGDDKTCLMVDLKDELTVVMAYEL